MPTALIIAYDHNIRVALRSVLEEAGYSVISKTDSYGAAQVLLENPSVMVVLLEWALKRSIPQDFLIDKLKSSSISSIPVMVIAGEDWDGLPISGVTDVFTKPITLQLVLEKVKQYDSNSPRSSEGV